MNRYSLWTYLLVLFVTLAGTLYALPNLYGDDPAVLISHADDPTVPEATERRIQALLDREGIDSRSIDAEQGKLLVRVTNEEDQLKLADALTRTLGRDFIIALNLAPRTPDWLKSVGAKPMTLGLDLRGGLHILLEVDLPGAIAKAVERYATDIPRLLREDRIRYRRGETMSNGFTLELRRAEDLDKALELISDEYNELKVEPQYDASDAGARPLLRLTLTPEEIKRIEEFSIKQNLTTIRNRVNELGVAEPLVQRQGRDRIVVQLPGVQDTAQVKVLLSATATLEFRPVYAQPDEASLARSAEAGGATPPGTRLYMSRDGMPILLTDDIIATGDELVDASSGFDSQSGEPAVFVTLDGAAAKRMYEFTEKNVGNRMAVVFKETKYYTEYNEGEEVRKKERVEEVISDAVIKGVFGKRFQTTGLTPAEATRLSVLLRAGALAAPVDIVEERTIGPSLGADNVEQGRNAVLIGFLLVVLFMAVYYKVFGLIANLALLMNLVLIIAVLSLLQATLTLPGIAGIVLTVGMAVDANVLIFERIREELGSGNSPQASISGGYDKAFLTIMDANITTLIAALVLFLFGTGPIKGFAVTLSIGIVTSMFTSIIGTRSVVNLVYGNRKLKSLSV